MPGSSNVRVRLTSLSSAPLGGLLDVVEGARAVEVPLGGDHDAGSGRHLNVTDELDRLVDRHLGPLATVDGERHDRLHAPARSAAVGGTTTCPSSTR